MIVIDGQDISISHGDTLDVIFELAEGYKVAETDTIIFSVKTTAGSSEVLLSKTIPFTAVNEIANFGYKALGCLGEVTGITVRPAAPALRIVTMFRPTSMRTTVHAVRLIR